MENKKKKIRKPKTLIPLDMSDSGFLKWRRSCEHIQRGGFHYWVLAADLLTNDEMYNQYLKGLKEGYIKR